MVDKSRDGKKFPAVPKQTYFMFGVAAIFKTYLLVERRRHFQSKISLSSIMSVWSNRFNSRTDILNLAGKVGVVVGAK